MGVIIPVEGQPLGLVPPPIDPGAALPPGFETVPIVTPVQGSSMGNQFGGTIGHVGIPSSSDPSQDVAAQLAGKQALLDRYVQLHGALPPAMAPAAPVAPSAMPIAPVPAAPSQTDPSADPSTAIPATAHTPAFSGPATHTPALAGDPSADMKQASGDLATATVARGQTELDAANAEAEARAHQVAQDQLGIERHQETARQIQQDIQRINDNQRNVLDEARKTTIPDFWEGREGAHAAGAISMALGEAGRALTAFGTGVNVGNTAKDLIDSNIRQYYARKKEEIDDLWKYASMTGQLGQAEKADYGQRLVNLQYEIAATHQSAADHINEVAAQSKGRIAQATALEQSKQQELTAAQLVNKARMDQAHLQLEQRRVGIAGYEAATGRMRELDNRNKQLNISMQSLVYDAQGKPFINAQSPTVANKFREQQRSIADLGAAIGELDQNYTANGAVMPGGLTQASRERAAIMSRIVLAAKTVGELGALSGPDMGIVHDIAGGKLGNILGAKDGIANLRKLQQNGMRTALSQIGAQPTPENIERFNLASAPPSGAGQPSEIDQAKAYVAAHPGDPRNVAIKAKYGF